MGSKKKQKKIEVIDLFCGIGGLSHGLKNAEIVIKAGMDNDSSCQYAYENNNDAKFICADIAEYDFSELRNYYSKNAIKVLVGCAPCQPFSSHTKKSPKKEKDNRWNLINYFTKAVEALEPEIISMENVVGIVNTDIFREFQSQLRDMGYTVGYTVAYCPDFGVPQSRRRVVLMGTKGYPLPRLEKTHSKENYITVKDVIGGLPRIDAGESYFNDSLHKARAFTQITLDRIKQSKPNGTWEDWDKKLLPKCYLKKSGQSYKNVYGRMAWKHVAPTLTTMFTSYGTGRFGHPEQNRALSIREGALLQTFPQDYNFGDEISFHNMSRHIGNAVPPKLGLAIGKSIINAIRSN